jgi:DNA polymerase-3 subunit delta
VKYTNFNSFEKDLTETDPFVVRPIYLFIIKEEFICQEAVELLLRGVLPDQQTKAFALSVMDGSIADENQFFDSLNAPSFLSVCSVLWIKHADKLKKSFQEKIEKQLLSFCSSTCLILTAPSGLKNSSLYQIAEEKGIVLEIGEVKAWEKEKRLIEWVNKQVTADQKHMPYSICQSFVQQIGLDQELLANELKKLLCFCADKKDIALLDIQAICLNEMHETIWQLGEALFLRQVATALKIAKGLLMEGQALLPLLRQIRAQFQVGYQVSLLLASGQPAHEVTREFPHMKGQILDRQLKQAEYYGLDSFRKGLLTLDATELRLKNSGIEENLLAELLIIQLTQQP